MLRIAGVAAGLALAPLPAAARVPPPSRRWTGTAMGARATILLSHPDGRRVDRVLARVVDELERIERIFSLSRPDSAISALNRAATLNRPPAELVGLVRLSQRLGEATNGAFDPTMQPLWRLYADHFAGPAADPAGPGAAEVARVRALIDYTAVEAGPRRIALGLPGMALTLNGVAQGRVADRVVDMLRNEGFDDLLVDMGETRVMGSHPSGRPWRVGIVDPRTPGAMMGPVELRDQALATSGGYGTPLDGSGRVHHLFDLRAGASARHYLSVTAIAARAVVADGLSTALSVSPPDESPKLVQSFRGTAAVLVRPDGTVEQLPPDTGGTPPTGRD